MSASRNEHELKACVLDEFMHLVNEVLQLTEELNRKFVAMGKIDALALDRVGQRGPGLFDR